MGPDRTLDELQQACGGGVRAGTADDEIAGVPAMQVATPHSADEVSRLLRVASGRGLAVVARGSGTKQDWGHPPERVDLVVQTSGLAGVREHASGDLVVVAGAGTTVDELQEQLGKADQQLALDSPFPDATLGGVVATSTSGPRRVQYGTMRDLLIGVTFCRGDGVLAKAGGKVVKNVAGYDFGKLLTGSYGTLGVVTEVALRLHPVTAARRYVVAEYAHPHDAARAASTVMGSQVVPAAVEIDLPADGPVTVAVLLEGVDAGVAGRTDETVRLLGAARSEEYAPEWFGSLPFRSGDVGVKISCPLADVGPVLARARVLGLAVRGSAAGVLHTAVPHHEGVEAVREVVEVLRADAAGHGGHVVVVTAPAEVRSGLDLWGPVPGLDLMRRLKSELDPGRVLAPGRFVGGI